MSTPIVASGITVEFPIYSVSARSIKKKILNSIVGGNISLGSHDAVTVRAISDLSFTCSKGDRIGLSGHNGAGKTTLLRTLAGVYSPSSGTLEVTGRVVSLLDLAMGMDSEATGYENIMIKGLMFGMKPAEIDKRYDRIAAFTDLGNYLDMPLRTYSSGMLLRLAFSVFSESNPDILLMDEWLSVGDANFSEKAKVRLHEMLESASVLVLASHSRELLNQVCNKHWHMEHGRIVELE